MHTYIPVGLVWVVCSGRFIFLKKNYFSKTVLGSKLFYFQDCSLSLPSGQCFP